MDCEYGRSHDGAAKWYRWFALSIQQVMPFPKLSYFVGIAIQQFVLVAAGICGEPFQDVTHHKNTENEVYSEYSANDKHNHTSSVNISVLSYCSLLCKAL
jgi:hypothetical protein